MLISAVGLAADSASRSSSAAAAAARICTVCRSTHRFSLPSRVRALRPPVLALENRRAEVGGWTAALEPSAVDLLIPVHSHCDNVVL